jgi:hypothetical protein
MYGQPAMTCSNGRFTCMVREPSDIETLTLSGYWAKLTEHRSVGVINHLKKANNE